MTLAGRVPDNDSDAFWNKFAKTAWSRSPMLFRAPQPLASEKECFDILVSTGEDFRSFKRHVGLSMFVDRGFTVSVLGKYLPRRDDQSLTHYAERIRQSLGGKEFTLFTYDAQKYDWEVFQRARTFLDPLYAAVGIPTRPVSISLFAGQYATTPTGIHRDNADNFCFVVSGVKTFVFWPHGRFPHSRRRLRDYEALQCDYNYSADEDAIILEGRPGDVFYWPSSYWHMAVSNDDRWSMTANIAIDTAGSHYQMLSDFLPKGYFESLGYAAPEMVRAQADLPNALTSLLDTMRRAFNSSEIEALMSAEWLRHSSAHGFAYVPEPVAVSDSELASRVQRASGFPILSIALLDTTVIAANGYVRAYPGHGWEDLIQFVNSNAVFSLEDLLVHRAGAQEHVRRFFLDLLCWRVTRTL